MSLDFNRGDWQGARDNNSKRRKEVYARESMAAPTSSSSRADQDELMETGPVERQQRGLLRASLFREFPRSTPVIPAPRR